MPWGGWEAAGVGLLALVVGSLLGGAMAAPIDADNESLQYAMLAIGFEFGIAGTVLFWIRRVRHRPISVIDLYPRRWMDVLRGALAGIVIFIGAFFGIARLVALTLSMFIEENVTTPEQLPDEPGSLIAVVLTGVAVLLGAPIGEELYFRGFLFRGLRRRSRFVVAAVSSGVIFGAIHYAFDAPWYQSILLCIPLSFVGVGFAWIYERYGNLLVPIAAHALFNTIGFILILTLS